MNEEGEEGGKDHSNKRNTTYLSHDLRSSHRHTTRAGFLSQGRSRIFLEHKSHVVRLSTSLTQSGRPALYVKQGGPTKGRVGQHSTCEGGHPWGALLSPPSWAQNTRGTWHSHVLCKHSPGTTRGTLRSSVNIPRVPAAPRLHLRHGGDMQ